MKEGCEIVGYQQIVNHSNGNQSNRQCGEKNHKDDEDVVDDDRNHDRGGSGNVNGKRRERREQKKLNKNG